MECPACGNALCEVETGSVVVDHCSTGCGGVWFDRLELKAVDEPHEAVPAFLLEPAFVGTVVDPDARRHCPRCEEDTVMMRRFASVKREVAVDECPGCGGFWLDGGELPRIRNEYRTETDRKRAALAFVGGGEGSVAGLAAETAANVDRHQHLCWIFNLLCRPHRGRW
jgi:hypothetical protein